MKPLTFILNKTLKLDPDWQQKIAPLANQLIQVKFNEWPITVFFGFETDRVQMFFDTDQAPELIVSGQLIKFLKVALDEDKSFEGLNIEGSISTAQAFQQFMQSLDLDWDGLFKKYIGSYGAGILQKIAAHAKASFQAGKSLPADVLSFLQDDVSLLVSHDEMASFCQDVQQFQLDVDKLQDRLAKCEKS